MRVRVLGATGLTVSEIGVGCSRIGGVLSPGSSRKDDIAMLREAADAGINFFDTADMYAQGRSESLLGEAFRGRRSEVVIATKGGYVVPAAGRLVARIKPLARPIVQRIGIRRGVAAAHGTDEIAQSFSPAYLRSAVEASLRRLRTDHIDLFQLHSPPRPVIERGEYISVLEEMRDEGKILHFGIAAEVADDVHNFDQLRGIESLQMPYNLVDRRADDEVLPKAADRGTAVIARSCYVAGLLKEDVTEARLREVTPDWREVLGIRDVARRLGRPALEVALQHSLAHPAISVTILGMRTPQHLRDNLRLHAAGALTPDELALLHGPAPTSQSSVDGRP